MLTPRQYISFSSLTTLEQNEQKWIDSYIYGEKQRISRNIAKGSELAESLESGELSGDPQLDLMAIKLPQLELADKIVEDPNGIEVWYEWDKKYVRVPFLLDKKDKIPLLAKPDSSSKDYSAILEYKTSVNKWTQKQVDDSGQLTFYTTAIWLATKKIPKRIELHQIQMAYDEIGRVFPTGEIHSFKTQRTMVDVIKMITRIKKAWSRIREITEREIIG